MSQFVASKLRTSWLFSLDGAAALQRSALWNDLLSYRAAPIVGMWFVLSAVDMYTGVGCGALIAGLRVEVYNSWQNVDHGSATGAWGVGK